MGDQVQFQKEFSIAIYCSDALSNGDGQAIEYAFSSRTTLQSLQYTDDELFVEEE
jgi:hypothetical protein